jgi:uncharacterized protein YkwD
VKIRRFGRALAAGLLVVLPLLRSPFPALAGGAPDNAAVATARVLELTNAERQRAGLAPLVLSPQLSQAAQRYSEVLSTDGCFGHTCGPVPEMVQRVSQAGYDGWTNVGENIAAGYPSPEAVVAGWMASPGHRENILSPAYHEIGLGLAGGGQLGAYWTQEFGSRPGVSSTFQAPPEQDPDWLAANNDDDE